ncbi:MAG: hypothetical protein PWP23_3220 [Candidatus Sumerlaeota bacterium]|nr:hypothetical protein [Candidatus Sumerlaeota bacterium]
MVRLTARTTWVGLLAGAALLATGCSKPTPEEQMTEAVELIQQGQTARGVMKLKEFVRESPDDPLANEARLLLARYHASEGNATSALQQLQAVYDKAGPSDPLGAQALEGLVTIKQQIQEYDEALALLDEAREQFPETDQDSRGQIDIWKANLLLSTNEPPRVEEAIALLRDLTLEAPEKTTRGIARENLASYYRQNKMFAESNALYRDYIAAYPDDSIVPQLWLAIAINEHLAGNEDESAAIFNEWADKIKAKAEEELESEVRGRKLLELAQNYAAVGRYQEAEDLMLRVMGENTRSRLAIETQFGIAEMYASAALQNQDDVFLEKANAILEQIARENKGTNIEESATRRTEELKSAMERYKEFLAQKEAAAMSDDSATSPTAE